MFCTFTFLIHQMSTAKWPFQKRTCLFALVWPPQENAADRREVAPTGCHMIGAGSLRFDTRDACGTGTLVILFVFSQWRGFSIFLKQG